MSILDWFIDSRPSEDVIDLYFVLSDLFDINLTDTEITERSACSALAEARARGLTTKNGHVYDAEGNDLGPAGKLNI